MKLNEAYNIINERLSVGTVAKMTRNATRKELKNLGKNGFDNKFIKSTTFKNGVDSTLLKSNLEKLREYYLKKGFSSEEATRKATDKLIRSRNIPNKPNKIKLNPTATPNININKTEVPTPLYKRPKSQSKPKRISNEPEIQQMKPARLLTTPVKTKRVGNYVADKTKAVDDISNFNNKNPIQQVYTSNPKRITAPPTPPALPQQQPLVQKPLKKQLTTKEKIKDRAKLLAAGTAIGTGLPLGAAAIGYNLSNNHNK